MIKKLFIPLLLVLVFTSCDSQNLTSITANDTLIGYEGRIDFSDSKAPCFSYQGVSIKCKFRGTKLKAILEELGTGGEQNTNYFTIVVDDEVQEPLKLESGIQTYVIVSGLENKEHTIELIKRTETLVGSVLFRGFLVDGKILLELPPKPTRSIEFIGDSWMTGYGNEVAIQSQPNTGFHSVNENYCNSWTAILARQFKAQHYCTAISGRGMYRNGGGSLENTLPLVYDRIDPVRGNQKWDFEKNQVDGVVIDLGTNDFSPEGFAPFTVLDSTEYVSTYIRFIKVVRSHYPKAKIICVFGNSKSDWWPEGKMHLTRWRSYMKAILLASNEGGELEVYLKELTTQKPPYGEDWHPSKATHIDIAKQMILFIKNLMNW